MFIYLPLTMRTSSLEAPLDLEVLGLNLYSL